MAEREADRACPERLRQYAVVVLVSVTSKEISPEFRGRLQEHNVAPSLFGASELASSSRSGLERAIVQNISAGRGVNVVDAIREALRQRGAGYAREQKCRLVTDCHPYASISSESVKKAFDDTALAAAVLILDGRPAPRISDRVAVNENVLPQPRGGGAL
jgi:hypothetical protein